MEDKGFILSGRIQDKNNKFLLKNQVIVLSYEDSIAQMKYYYTDSSGNFYFLLDQSYGNRDLIIQLIKNYENNDLVWTIDGKFSPVPEFNYNTKTLSPELQKYLQHCREIALVNNIYKNHIKENDLIDWTANTPGRRIFCGKPDYVVYPSDFLELYDFTEIAQNILPGVRFRKRRKQYQIQIYDPVNDIIMPPKATILLNGVPFTDLTYISTLGTKDIKEIYVYQTEILYGTLSFYGILLINTYDGKVPEPYLNKYTFVFNNKVQHSYEYSETNNTRPENYPDFRQSLYWQPALIITGKNKATIEFRTSELKGDYTISVQGITSRGIPLEAVSEFGVY